MSVIDALIVIIIALSMTPLYRALSLPAACLRIARSSLHARTVAVNYSTRSFASLSSSSSIRRSSFASPSSSSSSFSTSSPAPSSSSSIDSDILVAPAFGTNSHTDRRFVYIKGVKNDGRSKRFYDAVTLAPLRTARQSSLPSSSFEYAVLLDGRYIVTPYGQILTAPTERAAQAIAFEWDTQGDFIRPASMPINNICVTALDQSFTDRERFLRHFATCMKMDSVCFRVDAPSGLVTLQRRHWDPLLSHMRDRYDCTIATTLELETPPSSSSSFDQQQSLLASLTGWQLAALDAMTTVTKSFVISWCTITSRLTVAQAFEAARLEESYQMKKYGVVDGVYGHGIDMEFTRMTIAAAKMFVNLVEQDGDAINAHMNPAITTTPSSSSATL